MKTKNHLRIISSGLLAILAFLFLPTTTIFASGEITGWIYKTPMLSPMGGFGNMAAVGPNGKIYVFGGSSDNYTYIDLNQEYDPAMDSWALKSPIPSGPRANGGAVALQGKIYVIGGYSWSGTSSVNEAYDPMLDTWDTSLAPMPGPRYAFGTGVIDGKIYVSGGLPGPGDCASYLNTMVVYDPITNTWSPGTPMSTKRAGLSVAVTKGKLYAIGGYEPCSPSPLATVESYDPTTGLWTTRASMNEARGGGVAVVAGDGNIYVAGGGGGSQTDTVERYNPNTDTWTYETSMPYMTSLSAAASLVPDKFYVFGGYTPDGSTKIDTVLEATINVADTIPPTLTLDIDKPDLWPPNHKMVTITIVAHASDNSGPPVLSAIVSSNEPQNGLGDGDTAPDWSNPVINQTTGLITLQLRAERSGRGSGRIYTVAVTATDSSNNATTVPITILVPHDNGKK